MEYPHMKKNFLYCLLLSFPVPFWAQHHDNTLVFGYAGGHFSPDDDSYGLNILTFTDGNLHLADNQTSPLFTFGTAASISDSIGNLLFYTNGIHIEDADFKSMPNGRYINPDWADDDIGYPIPQGVLILPYPSHKEQYLVFYTSIGYLNALTKGGNGLVSAALSYAVVDMTARDGKGAVLNRKVSLLKDTLDYGKLTAVRHANGRDWWMPVVENSSNRF
jgi:hypothetical protein